MLSTIAELAAFVKQATYDWSEPGLNTPVNHSWTVTADNYTQDTREWPDPSEPRASQPPAPHGCTCSEGWKLECPVHGMHATESDNDYTWSQPQAQPIGYPQDAPRNWQQAQSKFVEAENRPYFECPHCQLPLLQGARGLYAPYSEAGARTEQTHVCPRCGIDWWSYPPTALGARYASVGHFSRCRTVHDPLVVSHSGGQLVERVTDLDHVMSSLSLFVPLKQISPLSKDAHDLTVSESSVPEDGCTFNVHSSTLSREWKVVAQVLAEANPVPRFEPLTVSSNESHTRPDYVDWEPYRLRNRRRDYVRANTQPANKVGDEKQMFANQAHSQTIAVPDPQPRTSHQYQVPVVQPVSKLPSAHARESAEKVAQMILRAAAKAATLPVWKTISTQIC